MTAWASISGIMISRSRVGTTKSRPSRQRQKAMAEARDSRSLAEPSIKRVMVFIVELPSCAVARGGSMHRQDGSGNGNGPYGYNGAEITASAGYSGASDLAEVTETVELNEPGLRKMSLKGTQFGSS